jgi:opacity protein-like surface antigen
MNKWIPGLICAVAVAIPAISMADPQDYDRHARHQRYRGDYDAGPYVGLSIGQLHYDEEGLDTIRPAAVSATLGVRLNPFIAVEGRIGGGLGRTETDAYGVEVRSVYAGYIKGMLPLSPVFSIYGLGGVAGVNLKRDFGAAETRDTGFSYGIGMDFNLYGGATISAEYTRLLTGNNQGYDYNVNMASVGVFWHF